MFFRFCNAPPTFQVFMNHIFTDMIAECWLKIYMDDLSIHTQGDLTLHHEHTRHVLLQLREHGLSLKLSKCLFNTPKMEFLGMILGQGQIAMIPGVCEFLSQIHPQFLPCCRPPQSSNSEGPTMELDPTPAESF